MLSAKARLAVAAALFLGWLGWLAYLVFQTRDPIVLSRPQFLVSNFHIIAHLTGSANPEPIVTVKEVVWASNPAEMKVGDQITITAPTRDALRDPADLKGIGLEQGWRGPDDYILPLMRWKDGVYRVTPVPPSPGYNQAAAPGPIRIYPATDAARRELAQLSPGK